MPGQQIAGRDPLRWEGIDSDVAAMAVIGQHAMAGTIHGYLDHTQNPRVITRLGRRQGFMRIRLDKSD